MYFSTELNAAEWAEQCQGLGCDMSQGVDFEAFKSLFLEYGARSRLLHQISASACKSVLSLSLSDDQRSPHQQPEARVCETGRDVVADFTLIFPLVSSKHVVLGGVGCCVHLLTHSLSPPQTEFRQRHGKSLMRFGLLLSHLYA